MINNFVVNNDTDQTSQQTTNEQANYIGRELSKHSHHNSDIKFTTEEEVCFSGMATEFIDS